MSRASGAPPKSDLLQSVQRACQVLILLAEYQRPVTIREISSDLGINLTTCYHLLNTLEHERFIARNGDRTLRLGQRIGLLARAYKTLAPFDERLVALLEDLNRRTGETSYLGHWEGGEVVSTALREGRGEVRVQGLHLGYREHSYARALGRALLAYRDDEFLADYFARTIIEPLTEKTITTEDGIRKQLAAVRNRGVAVEKEEFMSGVCCIAAPAFGLNGDAEIAFSVSVPKARYDREGLALIAFVQQAAREATELLHAVAETEEAASV